MSLLKICKTISLQNEQKIFRTNIFCLTSISFHHFSFAFSITNCVGIRTMGLLRHGNYNHMSRLLVHYVFRSFTKDIS